MEIGISRDRCAGRAPLDTHPRGKRGTMPMGACRCPGTAGPAAMGGVSRQSRRADRHARPGRRAGRPIRGRRPRAVRPDATGTGSTAPRAWLAPQTARASTRRTLQYASRKASLLQYAFSSGSSFMSLRRAGPRWLAVLSGGSLWEAVGDARALLARWCRWPACAGLSSGAAPRGIAKSVA